MTSLNHSKISIEQSSVFYCLPLNKFCALKYRILKARQMLFLRGKCSMGVIPQRTGWIANKHQDEATQVEECLFRR